MIDAALGMTGKAEGSSAPVFEASENTNLERALGWGEPEELGLALSGGGIRATLFHYGAILRLNELGHLRDIDRIAGVSGGAIAAGLLARVWDELEADDQGHFTNLRKKLEPPVMLLAGLPLDAPIVLAGLIPFVSPSKLLAWVLDKALFHGLTLAQLPQVRGGDRPRPRFVFNASDLATGTLFRFCEPYMGTYKVGLVLHPEVKVATAVAASASFPPFVAPMNIDIDPADVIDPGDLDGDGTVERPRKHAELHGNIALRRRAALVDGGAYDNLALEPITDRCHQYLVSDAGGNITVQPPTWKWWSWAFLTLRTLDIAVSQDRALRRSALFLTKPTHPFALWRTLTDPVRRKVPTPFPVRDGWATYLSTRSTRLWPFPDADRQRLINWGYVTSDVMLRAWIWKDAPAPTALPFPKAGFDDPPPGHRDGMEASA